MTPLIAALLVSGFLAGILAGMLGIGGGIVIIPAVYYLFQITGNGDPATLMHMAVGTSLAFIIPTSMVSARTHYRRGSVDEAVLKAWGPWVVLGVSCGAALAGWVRGPTLTLVFAGMVLTVALRMVLRPKVPTLTDHLPGGLVGILPPFLIGGLSAMTGIGGGSFSVPTLSAFGRPIHRAVGTAAAIGIFIALPGAVGFVISGWDVAGRPPLSLGYVNLLGFALTAPTAMVSAPLGVKLAHGIESKWLTRVFALFLVIAAAKMLYQVLAR